MLHCAPPLPGICQNALVSAFHFLAVQSCWLLLRIFSVLSLLVLCTLGSHIAIADTQEYRDYAIPYVTLRNADYSNKKGFNYGDERGIKSQGICNVRWKRNEILSTIGEHVDFYLPDGDADVVDIRPTSAKAFWDDYHKKHSGGKPLVYVHGYNVSFEKACLRMSQLQQSLGDKNRLILFSWPSDGATLNYMLDEADIAWSLLPLESFINDMISQFGDGGFDIVGHSLGTRGVVLALSRIANSRPPGAPPVIDQLLLMAADIDAGRAAQHMPALVSLAGNVSLYTSANDRALKLSENLHGYPRLGQSGAHLKKIQQVDIIDVSKVKIKRVSGHVYHLGNDAVITDLRELLKDRLPAARRTNLQAGAQSRFWYLKENSAE